MLWEAKKKDLGNPGGGISGGQEKQASNQATHGCSGQPGGGISEGQEQKSREAKGKKPGKQATKQSSNSAMLWGSARRDLGRPRGASNHATKQFINALENQEEESREARRRNLGRPGGGSQASKQARNQATY